MHDPLTIQDYRNFLADKLRLISELAVAIVGEDDPENPASIGFLIEAVDHQFEELRSIQYENERLRKVLENISIAHIETETDFSNMVKDYSRAMLGEPRVSPPDPFSDLAVAATIKANQRHPNLFKH